MSLYKKWKSDRSLIMKARKANQDEEWQQFLWEMEVVLKWMWAKSALFADHPDAKGPDAAITDLVMAIEVPEIRRLWIDNEQDALWFRGQDARRYFLARRAKEGLSTSGVKRLSMADREV